MARTAPAPNVPPTPGMCPHAVVLAGGAAGGGSGGGGAGSGGGGSGGAPGGGGAGAGDGSPGAASGSPDGNKYKASASAGEPIDPACGRVTTLPFVDIALPGPLPLAFTRRYSSHFRSQDVGLGRGWTHTFAWCLERSPRLRVWTSAGVWIEWAQMEDGPTMGPFGWILTPHTEGYWLDADDGLIRDFRPGPGARRWHLHSVRDAFGNTITLHYDDGRLAEIHDCVGRRLALSHDHRGHLSQLRYVPRTGAPRSFAHYSYDEQGLLVRTADAEGHAATFAYDARRGLLTRQENRVGGVFHYRYDRQHRCVESWGEDVGASISPRAPRVLADGTAARGIYHVRLDFHPDGFTEIVSSRTTRRLYTNAFGLVEKLATARGVLTYAYDAFGHLQSFTDAEGASTHYERDPRGRTTATIDPLERTTRRDLDDAGRVLRVVDPSGAETKFERNRQGRPTAVIRPDGATLYAEYDDRGQMRSQTHASGATTHYDYDEQGNLASIRDPDGRSTTFTHDELGRTIGRTDARGATTRFDYSLRGDLVGETVHDGSTVRYVRDGEGRTIERTDPTGAVERIRWGGFHVMVETVDALGRTVRMGYGREGELLDIVDEAGAIHEHDFDGDLNLVEERTVDGRRIRYRHDRRGLRTRVEESSGAITLLEHDAAGQLVRREYHDGSREELRYDARGLLIAAQGPDATVELERDVLGRVVVERTTVDGATFEARSDYDAAGARSRRETNRGHVLERHPQADGVQLHLDGTVTTVQGSLEEVQWNLGRGGSLTESFDAFGQLVEQRLGGPQPRAIRHHYDALGRWDATLTERGQTSLHRDAAGRLIEVLHDDGERETYAYDARNNPIGEERTYRDNRIERDRDVMFDHDDDGRLVRKRTPAGTWELSYDAAGRLARVASPQGALTEHRYDPLGRRIERLDVPAEGTGARRTCFHWDRHTLVHEEPDDGPIRTYVFEEELHVPAAHRDGDGEWRFYVNDPMGTPAYLVDAAGAVVGSQRLTSRGRLVERVGERTALRLQGQYEDPSTGLHYNRHRFYDPHLGRFITPDPRGISGGLNVFAAPRDPAFEIDPAGKLPTPHEVASGGDKEAARKDAKKRFQQDDVLTKRQKEIDKMSSGHRKAVAKDGTMQLNSGMCQEIAEAARDKLGAGKAVNIHGEVPTDAAGNVTDWDNPAALKRSGGGGWADHWVNEEPDGRIVDYDQGMVWDSRQQMVDNMFDNGTVYTKGYTW